MGDLVTIDVRDGVADVRLNRPDKINAVSPEMFRAIGEAGDQLGQDRSVRAVVLSGNGRGFCSGLDFQSFQAMTRRGEAREDSGPAVGSRDDRPDNAFQRVAYVWKTLPVPVIAAIHGVAFGAGIQIALGADIRIARPDAQFSIMEIKWGLVPDVGLTQTVRDVAGMDVVKDLVFTGRIVRGDEARELRLVTYLAENPLEAALARAREIAGRSPHAIRAGKRLLEEAWHATPAEGLGLEATLQAGLIGSSNQLEAVKSNFEKRPPRFEDPE